VAWRGGEVAGAPPRALVSGWRPAGPEVVEQEDEEHTWREAGTGKESSSRERSYRATRGVAHSRIARLVAQ
jgi:hypothetical protein